MKMGGKNLAVLLAMAVVMALLGGAAVYYWQQSALNLERELFKAEVGTLAGPSNGSAGGETIQKIGQAVVQMEGRLVGEEDSQLLLELIGPNGGESWCLGETAVVEWQSAGLDAVNVNLLMRHGGATIRYPLGTYPAEFNEAGEKGKGMFVWKVGESMLGDIDFQQGFVYRIEIMSIEGPSVSDKSDGVFSIIDCRG